jgi:hypothetical protein
MSAFAPSALWRDKWNEEATVCRMFNSPSPLRGYGEPAEALATAGWLFDIVWDDRWADRTDIWRAALSDPRHRMKACDALGRGRRAFSRWS